MYRISYAIAALFRFVLFNAFRPFAKYGRYDHPEQVMGYTGWFELPVIGVVAFEHEGESLQFKW